MRLTGAHGLSVWLCLPSLCSTLLSCAACISKDQCVCARHMKAVTSKSLAVCLDNTLGMYIKLMHYVLTAHHIFPKAAAIVST